MEKLEVPGPAKVQKLLLELFGEKKLMNEIKVKFDKKISLKEFDKQIPKLVENFPSKISLLIKVRIKMDCIFATFKENPNKNATERW